MQNTLPRNSDIANFLHQVFVVLGKIRPFQQQRAARKFAVHKFVLIAEFQRRGGVRY